MKHIFSTPEQEEILTRLEKLSAESKNLWGKMNSAQMLIHCARAMQMATGDMEVKPSPLRFIGKLFKKTFVGPKPFGKNSPTAPEIKVSDPREFNTEKEVFIKAFEKLAKGGKSAIKSEQHPFFGTMKAEEWATITYKHIDHHFQQFGV